MKKTYQKPALEQVLVEVQNLMAASPTFDDSKGTGEMPITTGSNSDNVNEGLSKETSFDLWDEE